MELRISEGSALAASLTHHRDLHTGRSLWSSRRPPKIAISHLTRTIHCDAVVVGAGISGALIAESLSDAGLRTVILDRRGAIAGSTLASTALLQYELDMPLSLMADRIGRRRAERIWRRSRLAVDALRERTERLGLQVEAVTRNSLYLDGNLLDARGLEREAEARRRVGLEVELLKPAAVKERYGIRGRHALLGFGNYSADPLKLAAGFLNVALARGARLYAPVDVADIAAHADGVTVYSAQGPEVRAACVIMATGYEMVKGIPRKGNRICSTWSIATRAQPRALRPNMPMIWEAAEPYLYIRTTPRGEVVCGGEDEEISDSAARDAKIAAKAGVLSRKLGALLPWLDTTPAFAWAGSFGDSPTSTPTVGRIPGKPNCYAALGYGGNGTTFSLMAAQMLRNTIVGSGDADADLVSFYRKF
ncbi:MAG TPA: FAD-dependent oxidoreductase [Hyphomicrobiales bacterium]|nr:FAD-dependent oxidoreductase [Hyphomicrobiales bacterium]